MNDGCDNDETLNINLLNTRQYQTQYAQQLAGASDITYRIIKGSDAKAGRYEVILGSDKAAAEQYDPPI